MRAFAKHLTQCLQNLTDKKLDYRMLLLLDIFIQTSMKVMPEVRFYARDNLKM